MALGVTKLRLAKKTSSDEIYNARTMPISPGRCIVALPRRRPAPATR